MGNDTLLTPFDEPIFFVATTAAYALAIGNPLKFLMDLLNALDLCLVLLDIITLSIGGDGTRAAASKGIRIVCAIRLLPRPQ